VDRGLARAPRLAVVGIDIPVGLHESAARQADLAVAARLGPRRSSLFRTPVRPALEQPTYAAANACQRALTGEGVSAQAYALRGKVLEVDRWRAQTPCRLVEVHPETSFAVLAGAPARHAKRTWAGLMERLALLASAGLVPPADLALDPGSPSPGPDDVVDALAAAWTAARVARGRAVSLPDPPEVLSDGTPCAIWA
jgi:predicted RNase H-like nuclease